AQAERLGFVVYAMIGALSAVLYRRLSPAVEPPPQVSRVPPLAQSRRVVLQLSALFSLDSFGGGFVVQSLLVLWLFRRFALPVPTAAAIFFAGALLDRTNFGWPLICAGALTSAYDLLLFAQFAHRKPDEPA